jgi:ABC-type transporter lipoprotein component MlaA
MLKKLVLTVGMVGVVLSGFSLTEARAQMGSAGQDEVAPQPIADPFEPFNQVMLSFNLKLDEYILHPMASGYAAVLPLGARQGVGRFFHNINIAPRLGNKLLQMKLVGAGKEFSRSSSIPPSAASGFLTSRTVGSAWKPVMPTLDKRWRNTA